MLKTIVATFQTVMGSSLSQQSAVETISHWRSRPSVLIFDSGRREISQYMEAVDRLQQSSPNVKGFNNELITTAMARLKREFVEVLRRQADNYHAGPVSATTAEWSTVTDSTYTFRYEDYVAPESLSDDVITYLRSIAERMNSSGKLGDCIEAYKSVRKSSLQAQLKRLRFEELGVGGNARRYIWDELKVKMEFWIETSKICVKILFEREKKLCQDIFQGLGDAKDECFVGTVQDFAVGLFYFARTISLSNQPYDKMDTILRFCDSFLWVLPNATAMFMPEPGKRIRDMCEEILSRFENEVGRMLCDFEYAVLNEEQVSSDAKGAVDQLTEYVMEQVNLIVRNKNLLTKLIKSAPSLYFDDLIPQEALGGSTSNHSWLKLHLILIIVVLQKNLQQKANCYNDPSLGQLFMMNNLRYVLLTIQGSNQLREMIGDSFMRLLNKDFKLAMTSYQASTCNKFLICFNDEGLYIKLCFKKRPSKTAVKKRLKAFDAVFKEIQRLHSSWTIPDSQLRDEVRVSMSEKLVPAYMNFLGKFGGLLDINIQYSTKDLEVLVLEKLFADTQVSS